MKFRALVILAFLTSFTISWGKGKDKKAPNVLLLCIDDLRPELRCFGAEYIHSPNIDALASEGVSFVNHYVNAPSCGPSRYTLLTGQYGSSSNHALFQRAEKYSQDTSSVDPSMPQWFRENGYTTVSVGKVSHNPGGLGGADWNDENTIEIPLAWDKHLMPVGEWQHPRGAMHGLANGETRERGVTAVYQSANVEDNQYPDGLIAQEGMRQLRDLAEKDTPFFLAIGLIKPHLPFGAPKKYLDLYEGVDLPPIAHKEKPTGLSSWSESGEFMGYNRWERDPREDLAFADSIRRHYAACVSYADMHVGEILKTLKESGADKNTIIVLWGDHGWHLGEHGVFGKHTLFEEALHSPLIVRYPGMKNGGEQSKAIIETLDIFPTLCELTGIRIPEYASGVSLKGQLENTKLEGRDALGYYNGRTTLRTKNYRMVVHQDGFVELYDHRSDPYEIENIASEESEVVDKLKLAIDAKMKQ